MNAPDFRLSYNKLRKISDLALNKTDVLTKYRGVHRDTEDISMHTRYVIAIRDKWFTLRREMIERYGAVGLEMEPYIDTDSPDNNIIENMWQHWRITKPCIAAVKHGLKKYKL